MTFLHHIAHIAGILWRYARVQGPLLLTISLFSSLFEMLGIGMMLPLLGLAQGNIPGDSISKAVFAFLDLVGFAPTLGMLLVLLIALFTGKGFAVLLTGILTARIMANVRCGVQKNIVQLIGGMSYATYTQVSTGHLTNIITRECSNLLSTINNFIKGIVLIVTITVFFFSAFLIRADISLFIVVAGLITMWLLKGLVSLTRQYSIRLTAEYGETQSALIQFLQNLPYLKATASIAHLHRVIDGRIDNLARLERRQNYIASFLNAIKEPLAIVILAVLVYYQVLVQGQRIEEVLVLGLLFYRLFHNTLNLQNNWQRINQHIGGAFAVEQAFKHLGDNQESKRGGILPDFSAPLVLDHVTVSLCGKRILDDINLSIASGDMVGIVGPSGSGKTTLFHLVTGLLSPDAGHIRLGSVDYSDLDLDALRSRMGYVSQEPVIVDDTIAANIAFCRCDPTEPECRATVVQALEGAGAEDLFPRLFEPIGERGTRLSGGQRQRIAIARELFKKPNLLIFDEATSALDSQSEAAVQETIRSLKGRQTVLLISHRLSMVRDCDCIFVMADGRIVEAGSFQGLWARPGGLFRTLCEQQHFNGLMP